MTTVQAMLTQLRRWRAKAHRFLHHGDLPPCDPVAAPPFPPLRLLKSARGMHLQFEIPGADVKTLVVILSDNILEIRGRMLSPEAGEILRSERHRAGFERFIRLPFQIDTTKAKAAYRNGILTVLISKGKGSPTPWASIPVEHSARSAGDSGKGEG